MQYFTFPPIPAPSGAPANKNSIKLLNNFYSAISTIFSADVITSIGVSPQFDFRSESLIGFRKHGITNIQSPIETKL
jgi:hypothetical protein